MEGSIKGGVKRILIKKMKKCYCSCGCFLFFSRGWGGGEREGGARVSENPNLKKKNIFFCLFFGAGFFFVFFSGQG